MTCTPAPHDDPTDGHRAKETHEASRLRNPAVPLFLAGSACAQTLFHTGFENAAYVIGQTIDGIDNWFSFISPDAPEIADGRHTASSGRRALTCWCGSPRLQSTQGLLDGAWAQTVLLDPNQPNNNVVCVQCDVRLDGPDTGVGPANDV